MTQSHAFKVGLVTLVLGILISVLLVWKSGLFLKASGYPLVGEFQSVGGLLQGAEVRYRGYRVGKVFSIKPARDKILVYFWVERGTDIPKGSYLSVMFDGLVGEKLISIRPPIAPGQSLAEAPALHPGDRLPGYSSAGLSDAVEIGTLNLQHTEVILRKMKELFASQETTNSIANSIKSIEVLATQLSGIASKLNSARTFDDIQVTVQNIRSLTAALQGMSKEISTPETAADIKKTIRNLSQFSESLNSIGQPESDSETRSDQDQASVKSGGIFSTIRSVSSIKVKPKVSAQYSFLEKKSAYEATVDFANKSGSFIRTAVGNRMGETALTGLQLGMPVSSKLKGRAGFFYTQPGVGVDYQALPNTVLSADFYQPEQVQVELTSRTSLLKNWDVLMNLRKDPASLQQLSNFSLGLSYKL